MREAIAMPGCRRNSSAPKCAYCLTPISTRRFNTYYFLLPLRYAFKYAIYIGEET